MGRFKYALLSIAVISLMTVAISVVPSQVLSPVMGDLEQIGPNGICSGTKWCFNQHQTASSPGSSIGHIPNGGVCHADDTYAWDANLNTPSIDYDAGKPVYAVASGVVAQTFGGCLNTNGTVGQVLIEHNLSGSIWWSGYLHLNPINVSRGQNVTANTIIGYVSNAGATNNHLHFAVYTGQNSDYNLKSFDTFIQPRNSTIVKPTVTNGNGATSITANSARLNGVVTNTGGENPTVRIYFGPVNGETNQGSWANYAEGVVSLGPFFADIDGFNSGTPYYYRCYASNSAGSSWASSTANFTTLQGSIGNPNTPSMPSGQTNGTAGTNYSYSTSATDPNGNQLRYTFDWGDGTTYTTGLFNSGATSSASHSWSVNTGSRIFYVRVQATDTTNLSSNWSNSLAVTITASGGTNRAPTVPSISGPTSGITGVSYDYSFSANDADGDLIKYTITWGDGNATTEFTTPGVAKIEPHTWSRFDGDTMKLPIYARATDTHGASSDQSNGYQVIITNQVIPPIVTNGIGATMVTAYSARLNGEITDTGGQHPVATIYWGSTDGGTTPDSWAFSSNEGSVGKQTFGADISGLTPGTWYYYRCHASNSAGSSWAGSTITFKTKSPPNVPSMPSGNSSGIVGTSYSYSTSATDSDGDQVKILFNWGDNSPETTVGWVNSGTIVSAAHSWNSSGTYSVRAAATDGLLFSNYSNPRSVSVTGQSSTNWKSGRTTPGATDWKAYGTNAIYVDVNTSSAGFTSTPRYFTSLGGNGNHWDAQGISAIYSATSTGFRIYLKNPSGASVTPSFANSKGWHVQWLGVPTTNTNSGSTPKGTTNWTAYGTNAIYVDVNTSSAGFTSTPRYFTSLGGNGNHWEAQGISAIYSATSTGFRIYLKNPSGAALTPSYANSKGWHVQWLGVPTTNTNSGSTSKGTTNWTAYGTNAIYVNVNTSSSGFTSVPRYFTSLGGNGNHWEAQGISAIYSATSTGFRIYLKNPSGAALTPSFANSKGWHFQWLGA